MGVLILDKVDKVGKVVRKSILIFEPKLGEWEWSGFKKAGAGESFRWKVQ